MEGEINFVHGVNMTVLEEKKIQAELARVKAARLDMEVRVEELQEAFARMAKDIKIQQDKEAELQQKLDNKEK
jgi:hypothetical protein